MQQWADRGGAGVGVGVGSVSLVDRPPAMTAGRFSEAGAPMSAMTAGMVMLGLRYRPSEDASVYASATHLSGAGFVGDDRAVVPKVGVEFQAARSNFKIDYGGLGMHFSGDTRMTVKLRHGGLAIGMKRNF